MKHAQSLLASNTNFLTALASAKAANSNNAKLSIVTKHSLGIATVRVALVPAR